MASESVLLVFGAVRAEVWMRFRLIIATAASFSVALPATHGKVIAGCTFLHFSLKAAWLRGLDSLGTHDHLIIHCIWAQRWEEPSRSSNLHLDSPTQPGQKWAFLVRSHLVRLEPEELFSTHREGARPYGTELCPRESNWEAYSSCSVKQRRPKKGKEVWTPEGGRPRKEDSQE